MLPGVVTIPSISVRSATCLRACHAMSGTDIALSAYALSGTALAPGTISLRACYATSGTKIAYCATYFRTCYYRC
eukprot:2167401-Rhodomonas_salina.3